MNSTGAHGKSIGKRAASGGGASFNIVGCSITHAAMAIRANNVEAGSSREERPENRALTNLWKRTRTPDKKNAPRMRSVFSKTSRRRPTLPRLWDAVPSALRGLASEFGMGSGVSPTVWPPEKTTTSIESGVKHSKYQKQKLNVVKPHDRLVRVSSTCCHASTSRLSTRWSTWGLQGLAPGRPYLGVGFPLRCFQRLSFPSIATQLCRWHDNWCTRGSSIPVLSY